MSSNINFKPPQKRISMILPVDQDVIKPHPFIKRKDFEESDFRSSEHEILLILRVKHSPMHQLLGKYIFSNKKSEEK